MIDFVLIMNSLLLSRVGVILLQVPMADSFRSHGKIYVVVAVVLILLIGLFAYLFTVDRKLKRLEKEIKEKKSR